jgi:hypothetical protein
MACISFQWPQWMLCDSGMSEGWAFFLNWWNLAKKRIWKLKIWKWSVFGRFQSPKVKGGGVQASIVGLLKDNRHFFNIFLWVTATLATLRNSLKKKPMGFPTCDLLHPHCTTKVQLEVWLISTTKLAYVLGIEATYLAYQLTSNLSTYYLPSISTYVSRFGINMSNQ